MNCLSEITYSVYADGELQGEQAQAVEQHLATCARCRRLVAGLRSENQMLREVLAEGQEAVAVPAWPPDRPRAVAGPLLAVLAALAGLRIAVGALFDLELPAGLNTALEWLNPFHLNTQLDLFFRGVFFVAEEGASMFALTITVVGVLIVLLLAVFASLLLRRQSAQISATMLAISMILAVVLATPPRAAAVEVRRGQKMETMTVPSGQTINDSLIITGETVTIDGVVTGNLIAVGRRVRIRGTVQGDVVAGCQGFELEGTVNGNVYSFSKMTSIRGQIHGSLHTFSESFHLESAGAVGGDILTFSADSTVEGTVARDVMSFARIVEARGKIGRNLFAAADSVLVSGAATVGGNLKARVPTQSSLTVDPTAKVSGKTDVEIRSRPGWQTRLGQPRFYFFQAVQFVGAMIIGALLLMLFPGFYRSASTAIGSWGRSIGLGFAALVAGPVAIVIMAITLVGIPLAVVGLFLYITGLYLAKIFFGAWLGQALFRRPSQTNQDALLALALGLLIIFIVVQIPFFGALFHCVVLCLGLGVLAWRLYDVRQPA